jgi:xanthine phosphoribosyltransferase
MNMTAQPHMHGINWNELQADCAALAAKLSEQGPWQGIVAIARGGLIPAGLLANALDIRRIETLSIKSYDGQKQGELKILSRPEIGDGAGWLIVDDLVDSGKTFASARTLFPKARFACLYAKPEGRKTADIFVREFPQDVWINFPWEMGEED